MEIISKVLIFKQFNIPFKSKNQKETDCFWSFCKLKNSTDYNTKTNDIYTKAESHAAAVQQQQKLANSEYNRLKTIKKYLKIITEVKEKQQMQQQQSQWNSIKNGESTSYSKQVKALEHSKRTKWAIIVGVLVVVFLVFFYLFAIIPLYTMKQNKREAL
jgi:CHASE3 domain sensor protein